ILATTALTLVASPATLKSASGLREAFELIGHRFGWEWFPRLKAFLLTFAELADVRIWLLAPVVMFFKCTHIGIIPECLHK
ncbi:amino acid transporter, partial [Francisella tularensis subsp. holarctica]|nr:amino acid transporter [Francisella tularensis subsp. holarctica]